MPRSYNVAPLIGAPTLAHTLTEGAELARQAVRRFAHKRRLDAQVASLVTKHGNPPRHRVPIPAAAERFRKLAESKGFKLWVGLGHWKVNAGKSNERLAPAWTVAGAHMRKRVGFRLVWADGKAASGEWWSTPGLPAEHVGVGAVTERVRGM